MKALQILLLIALLAILCNIRVAVERWGNELTLTKVTTVEHHYRYDVQSYGVLKIDDEIVNLN